MEDAGTSEEDDIDSQDSNIPTDHSHLAWNCLLKIIMPAVQKATLPISIVSKEIKIFDTPRTPTPFNYFEINLAYPYLFLES